MAIAIRSSKGVEPVKIRITSVPPGAAPLWVREKWVGLELTSVLGAEAKTFLGMSVLARPSLLALPWRLLTGRTQKVTGYPVQVSAAIDALEKSSPEAAGWWRANTQGSISPSRLFVFDAGCCEPVRPTPDTPVFDR